MGRGSLDEFLVAIMSGVALICYTVLTWLLFDFKWKKYVRWGLLLLIVLWIFVYLKRRKADKKRLTKMGVDAENYVYYHKYTSFGNKFSYIFTYLLQDFIYEVKRSNKAYNFSKGLFRFDDSLGEYYIDCRLGWYSYIRYNILKNRLSLHKLRIFSLGKCNEILLEVLPEQKEIYKEVFAGFQEKVNGFPKGKKLGLVHLNEVNGSNQLHQRIRKNLYEMEVSRKFMIDHMENYHTFIKKQERRKDDVRDIKNLHVDLDENKG